MSQAKKIGAVGGAALVIAVTFIKPWEGLWMTAKVDRIGTGRPITWCYGQTDEFGKVKVGTKFTPQQCSDLLAKSLPKYANAIAPCIKVPVSDKEFAAYISFAYNVGTSAACHSNAFARLNRGDHQGACAALLNWSHAQGKFVQGLWNRRSAERKLCLEGIDEAAVHRFAELPKKASEPSFWEKLKLAFKFTMKG